MNRNCLLCGVGGQGVVLASRLIACAAMEKGMFVRTSETIGMAQRGGSVVSHVRMGEEIYSPMIPKGSADVILAFEPAEAVRSLDYLRRGKEEGIVIVNQKGIQPVTAALGGQGYDGQEMLCFLKGEVKRLYIVTIKFKSSFFNSSMTEEGFSDHILLSLQINLPIKEHLDF